VVAMAPAARPVLRKPRRVIELTLTSVWLKRVGEPDQWMLARYYSPGAPTQASFAWVGIFSDVIDLG
jgi:hypothetical protein